MKNTISSALLVLVFIFSVCQIGNIHAQTNIPGGNVSGTWDIGGSPYLVQGPIMIPNGSTLVIRPGVTVDFQGAYKFLVLGCLEAIGTISDSITFTAANTVTGWRGIRFDSTFSTNDTSRISYCKIQYATTEGAPSDINGGGVYINSFSKIVISNSHIRYNKADFYCGGSGAGIFCQNSSPVIKNNLIEYNSASFTCYGNGGGICCTGMSDPKITGNTIMNNAAGYGGGINFQIGYVADNLITGNYSLYNGGGIGIWGFGGMSTQTIVENNRIAYNTSEGWLGGGGIYCENGKAEINNNVIDHNFSLATGGGGLYCATTPHIYRNLISNNTASNLYGGKGGGIYCTSGSGTPETKLIDNNILTNNNAANGGAIFFEGFSGNLVNNTIVNNFADNGGALYCSNNSNPIFRNCILWGNTSSTSTPNLYLFDEPSDPDFFFCDVQGGSADFSSGGNFYTGNYSDNIDLDPDFVLPTSGSDTTYNGTNADWSLESTSPCIESGDPAYVYSPFDKAGNIRISGCNIDLGAFEMQVTNSLSVVVSVTDASDNYSSDGCATVIVTGGTEPYTYQWSSGSTSSTTTGLDHGEYTVTVTDANNCIRVLEFFVSYPNAIAQVMNEPLVSVFPNPASDWINISVNSEMHAQLLNSQGQILQEFQITNNSTKISVEELPAGLYFLRLVTDESISNRKIIKN